MNKGELITLLNESLDREKELKKTIDQLHETIGRLLNKHHQYLLTNGGTIVGVFDDFCEAVEAAKKRVSFLDAAESCFIYQASEKVKVEKEVKLTQIKIGEEND